MKARGTIAAGIAGALSDLAVARGAPRDVLLRRAGIDLGELQDPDARVAIGKYMALMRAGQELAGDPALALHFGEAYDLADLSIVGLLGAACARPAELVAVVNRFVPLAMEVGVPHGERFRIQRAAAGTWFVDERDDPNAFPEFTETLFARVVCMARRRYGHARWVKAIHVTHREPAYRAQYDRVFGMPVVFRSRRNALLIDEGWLELPLPPAPAYARRVFRGHAERLLARLEATRTMRGRVEDLLTSVRPIGAGGVGAVARRLAVSRQTLFRRLRAEGATFAQIRREVRLRLATQYLRDQHLNVSQTADRLGYSDATAFARAFRRWTGVSPTRFARRHPATAAPPLTA